MRGAFNSSKPAVRTTVRTWPFTPVPSAAWPPTPHAVTATHPSLTPCSPRQTVAMSVSRSALTDTARSSHRCAAEVTCPAQSETEQSRTNYQSLWSPFGITGSVLSTPSLHSPRGSTHRDQRSRGTCGRRYVPQRRPRHRVTQSHRARPAV